MAAAFWKRNASKLIEAGRLTESGVDAFALLCRMTTDVDELEQLVAKEGSVVETERGPITNPRVRILRDARRDWVALARDFGLTAASAARIPSEGSGHGEEEGDSEEAQLRAFTGSA